MVVVVVVVAVVVVVVVVVEATVVGLETAAVFVVGRESSSEGEEG